MPCAFAGVMYASGLCSFVPALRWEVLDYLYRLLSRISATPTEHRGYDTVTCAAPGDTPVIARAASISLVDDLILASEGEKHRYHQHASPQLMT